VQVQILGQQLPLRTEADPKYAIELAEYVDGKMREVTKMLPVASVSKVAILASLNIADELFKERANKQRTGSDFQDRQRYWRDAWTRSWDEVRQPPPRSDPPRAALQGQLRRSRSPRDGPPTPRGSGRRRAGEAPSPCSRSPWRGT
jgi:cell division protein ZapA